MEMQGQMSELRAESSCLGDEIRFPGYYITLLLSVTILFETAEKAAEVSKF